MHPAVACGSANWLVATVDLHTLMFLLWGVGCESAAVQTVIVPQVSVNESRAQGSWPTDKRCDDVRMAVGWGNRWWLHKAHKENAHESSQIPLPSMTEVQSIQVKFSSTQTWLGGAKAGGLEG